MKDQMAEKLMTTRFKPPYSLGEEIANAITHGLGVFLSVSALVLLIVRAVCYAPEGQTGPYVVGFTIFGASLILLYLMSTLYHAISNPRAKHIFSILDHCAIYVLIAGTYTAFCLSALYGASGWTLFGIIWFLAVVGILVDIFCPLKVKTKLSLGLYLLMGWLCLTMIRPLSAVMPSISITCLFIGGVSYTVGCIFFVIKNVQWMHSIWHLFVLGGSIMHFFSIFFSIPLPE